MVVGVERVRSRLPPRSMRMTLSCALLGVAALVVACQSTPAQTPTPTASSSTVAPSVAATPTPSEAPAQPSGEPSAEPTPKGSPQATTTPSPPFASGPIGQTDEALVVRVVDGDTIRVELGGVEYAVRYVGVDTPETVHPSKPIEWMGREASDANKRLVEDRTVVLEKDVSETDRYGRLLRYVWLREGAGWLLVNAELLRLGFAQVSTYPPDVKYVDTFLELQRGARDAGLGLWGQPPDGGSPEPTPNQSGDCDPSYPTVCIPPTRPISTAPTSRTAASTSSAPTRTTSTATATAPAASPASWFRRGR